MRKVDYRLTVTTLPVAVALVVGTVELLDLAVHRLRLHGGAWEWVAAINTSTLGYLIVGPFVLTWVASLAIWRLARVEERWSGERPAIPSAAVSPSPR